MRGPIALSIRCLLAAGAVALTGGTAGAHVDFEAPPADAVLIIGSSVELRWVDVIQHQTTAYHLELRTDALTPGLSIAADLPPTQHSFEWQVPDQPCDACWLYIVQDNLDSDYVGLNPISIVAEGTPVPDAGTDGRVATGMHVVPTTTDGGCAVTTGIVRPSELELATLAVGLALLLGRRRHR